MILTYVSMVCWIFSTYVDYKYNEIIIAILDAILVLMFACLIIFNEPATSFLVILAITKFILSLLAIILI